MKPLPLEGRGPHQNQKSKTFTKGKVHQLAHFRVEIRKISKRLNKYADSPDLPDHEVMDLLEETRRKVIGLHVARQNLRKKSQRNKPSRRHPGHQ
jgi:hypothetical protein